MNFGFYRIPSQKIFDVQSVKLTKILTYKNKQVGGTEINRFVAQIIFLFHISSACTITIIFQYVFSYIYHSIPYDTS